MVSGMETNNKPNNNSNPTSESITAVAREFVRQYYTILNKNPNLMHRFYSGDSYFVNGALDRPGEVSVAVYGQENINKKILDLNFKDCHAKIIQVDAMETIGKGVVIQLSGEFSNDGQPMRKFLQTFVLAPQSPTKFYVKNDIFRYQDDIFVDDDDYTDAEKASTDGGLDKSEVPLLKPIDREETIAGDVPPVRHHQPLPPPQPIAQEVNIGGGADASAADLYGNTNGSIHEPVDADGSHADSNDAPVEKAIDLESTNTYDRDPYLKSDGFAEANSSSPQPPLNEPILTYANMLKNPKDVYQSYTSNTYMPKVGEPPVAVVTPSLSTTPFPRPMESPIPPSGGVGNPAMIMSSVTGKPPNTTGSPMGQPPRDRDQRPGRPQRNPPFNRRTDSREMTPGRAGPTDSDSADGDYREKKQFPDENQVFVGNLPQMINDDDLRNFFTKFGKILDVRINRQNQKQGNNNKTPNYGFVTFENPDIVQQILKQKPIYFENHRFNVEEKRSQSGRGSMSYERNPNREPRPGGMGGGSGGRMNNPMGMRPQNDRPSGGNPRNRNPFNPGGGPRGPGGPASGGGGFGAPNRNNSFNNRQNQR